MAFSTLPQPAVPFLDPKTGIISAPWYLYLQSLSAGWLYGSGAPASNLGINGNFYGRSDGSGGSYIYHKASGSWTAIL